MEQGLLFETGLALVLQVRFGMGRLVQGGDIKRVDTQLLDYNAQSFLLMAFKQVTQA